MQGIVETQKIFKKAKNSNKAQNTKMKKIGKKA